MPTKRFAKLRPYKQEAIRHAVMKEFQRTPYGEMQISNIARTAHISRGSLYTYFYNRQDMFLYALDQSWREMLEYDQKKLLDCRGDYWEMLKQSLAHQMEICGMTPIYRLLYLSLKSRMAGCSLQEESGNSEGLWAYQSWLFRHADQNKLGCTEAEFFKLSDQCSHLLRESVQHYLLYGEDEAVIQKEFERKLEKIQQQCVLDGRNHEYLGGNGNEQK